MRTKDTLAIVIEEEVLARVELSTKFDLVFRRSLIGSLDAITLTLRGEDRDKHLLRLPVNRLGALTDALARVQERVASDGDDE